MKRIWLCVAAAVVLSSCTPVENFGAYWDKGVVDPALEGSWKKIGLKGEDPASVPGPDQWRFVRSGASYSQFGINPVNPAMSPQEAQQLQADNARSFAARTLRVGKQSLLMQREGAGGDGILARYVIRNGTLSEYFLENGAALEFLEARHPGARNIGKNRGEGEYVVIKTFDDEVFRILSEIADDPTYWILTCQYKKVSK